MAGGSVLVLVIALAVICLPLATYYRPHAAGLLGVLALTAGAIYFLAVGKSAMSETTAAVLAVGAFLLAGVLAIARAVDGAKDEISSQRE